MTEKRALDSSSMCNGLPREDNFCNFRTLQAAIFLLQLQGGPMPISLAGSLGHLLPDLTNDSANFFYVICSQTKKKRLHCVAIMRLLVQHIQFGSMHFYTRVRFPTKIPIHLARLLSVSTGRWNKAFVGYGPPIVMQAVSYGSQGIFDHYLIQPE